MPPLSFRHPEVLTFPYPRVPFQNKQASEEFRRGETRVGDKGSTRDKDGKEPRECATAREIKRAGRAGS